MSTHEQYTEEGTFPYVPKFIREIRDLTDEQGLVEAAHHLLERDGIRTEFDGDIGLLENHDGGILLVGDHKDQLEFVPAIELMHHLGRQELIHIVKFYVQRQVRMFLGETAASHLVPVYPKILASDRGEFWNAETLNRVLYRRSLLSRQDSQAANRCAVSRVSTALSNDEAANIYPCGSIVDGMHAPWRPGLGHIIREIHADKKDDVLIVPYQATDIRRLAMLTAIMRRGKGRSLHSLPQNLTLRLGPIYSAAEIIEQIPQTERDRADVITKKVQEKFVDYFST